MDVRRDFETECGLEIMHYELRNPESSEIPVYINQSTFHDSLGGLVPELVGRMYEVSGVIGVPHPNDCGFGAHLIEGEVPFYKKLIGYISEETIQRDLPRVYDHFTRSKTREDKD